MTNIYIKADKQVDIYKTGNVHIKDIADISAPSDIKSRIDNITVYNIKSKKEKYYLVTIIDVINKINQSFSDLNINNVGEIDILIRYKPQKESNKLIKYLKISAISVILMAGSATAIMSFHTDAQLSTVFENYYYMFFNEKIENPAIINIPYAIGLSTGIVIFFNHLSNKKLTSDPTPIEVEMTTYKKEIDDNIIETLSKVKKDDN